MKIVWEKFGLLVTVAVSLYQLRKQKIKGLPARQGFFLFLMLSSCFSSSTPTVNVYNSELAKLAVMGNTVKRCYLLAIEKTANILGVTEHEVFVSLPVSETFTGFVSVNGKQVNCTITYSKDGHPVVS